MDRGEYSETIETIVNLHKKSDVEGPGEYKVLNVVGKVFCKILINHVVIRLKSKRALHERQAGFREKKTCVGDIFSLHKMVE